MEGKQYVTKKNNNQRNQRGKKHYLETNKNENTMIQNLWDSTKPFLRGNCIAMQGYLRKQEKSQII